MRAIRWSVISWLLLLLMGCYARRPSGTTWETLPVEQTSQLVRAAAEARIGEESLGAAATQRAWRWRPIEGPPFIVAVACRGSGSGRACAMVVLGVRRSEQPDSGTQDQSAPVRVLGAESCGWSVPVIAETADPYEIVASGEDGRGVWRQSVRYGPENGGTITFSRRMYPFVL